MTEAAAAHHVPPAGTSSHTGSSPLRLLTDERLARRAAKGDQRAFEAIYRRHEQALYRFCLAMAGNPQDAQEALQNTMVKVLRALPGEERQIRLKPWLYRIARNETIEVLRRRRDSVELDTDLLAVGTELADTAAARERLRDLFADLEQLPERQRAALVMRELSGMGFDQIGESFQTSAAVARQTVYEARLGLREMEAGREMSCDAITAALSDDDGRVVRRRDIRAHLRRCEGCRAFRDGIERRRDQFAAIAPVPLALSGWLLQGAFGAGKTGAAAGAATGTAGGTAVLKSVATVAVVAAIGVTAADRGGLVDLPVLGGGGSQSDVGVAPSAPGHAHPAAKAGPAGSTDPGADRSARAVTEQASGPSGDAGERQGAAGDRIGGEAPTSAPSSRASIDSEQTGHGRHVGQPEGLPPASQRGQETAAAHKPPPAATPPGPGGSGGAGTPAEDRPEPPSPPSPPAARGVTPPPPPADPPPVDPPVTGQGAPGKAVADERPPAKP